MSNLFQFFNDLEVKENTESTIRNIDNLGIRMLNMNQRIDPRLLNEYKLLDTYRLQLLQSLSLIDSIMNKKNKCQNSINGLLNTILKSRNSEQLGGMRNILIDHMFNSMKYRQYGGVVDANTTPDKFLEDTEVDGKKLNIYLNEYKQKSLTDYDNKLKIKLNDHKKKLLALNIYIGELKDSLEIFVKTTTDSLINSAGKSVTPQAAKQIRDNLEANVIAYQEKLKEIVENFKKFIEIDSDVNIEELGNTVNEIDQKVKTFEGEIKKIDPLFEVKAKAPAPAPVSA